MSVSPRNWPASVGAGAGEASRHERAPEPVDELAVLVVGEVADRLLEVDGEIELGGEIRVAHIGADEVGADAGRLRRLAGAPQLGLVEVHAGHLVPQPREGDRVAAEAARRVEHAPARLEPGHADDPAHGAARPRLGLERLRDRRPRFPEEPFALEHAGYYSRAMTTLVTGARARS